MRALARNRVNNPPHNSPASRRYPDRPVAGVGALLFEGGKVLLVQRGQEPLRGWWSLPGGAIELGEPILEALRREVREETGLEIEPIRLAEIFERIQPDREGRIEFHYVVADWVCRVTGGTPQPGTDAAALRWVAREDLASLQITSGTLEIVLRHWPPPL